MSKYTRSEETDEQRRRAARKTGANARKGKKAAGKTVRKFDPFPDIEDNPDFVYAEILNAMKSGDPAPYDAIEAALLTLLQVEIESIAELGAVTVDEDDEAINLHLVALRELQSCYKSFRASRGKPLPKKPDRIKTVMQKKLAKRHMERVMKDLKDVN